MTGQIVLYTDGSAKGNPGPSGWCWWHAPDCWGAGGFDLATNNIAELTAVEQALVSLAHRPDLDLLVVTDSTYVMKSLTEYIHSWKRNGWMTSARKPVANVEIIRSIDKLIIDRGGIKWQWQKGHVGAHGNTQADAGASAAAESFRGRTPCPAGPGWTLAGSTVADKPASSPRPSEPAATLF